MVSPAGPKNAGVTTGCSRRRPNGPGALALANDLSRSPADPRQDGPTCQSPTITRRTPLTSHPPKNFRPPERQQGRPLNERLKADVREYNELSQGRSTLQMANDDPRIVISRTRDHPPYDSPWTSLEKRGNYLFVRAGASAHTRDIEEIRLVPTLNAEGQCRLRRGNHELELWQASRLILEPLLSH